MRTKLVRVGKGRALRLPKRVRDSAGFGDWVNLYVEPGRLIITPSNRPYHPRAGWAEATHAEKKRGRPPVQLLW